jgi:hypothetical protein
MQRYDLSKKQCTLDGYLTQWTAPVQLVEPNRKEIEVLMERAISCICTYTPSGAQLRVDARLLRGVCLLALKVKPKRFKLKVKHEKGNCKAGNKNG